MPSLPSCYPPSSRLELDDLLIGGCSVTELCREFGTPAYLVDEQALRDRAREYREAFRSRHPDTDVAFASKAFPCSAVYRLFAEEDLGCDVVGHGELHLALAGGYDPARIYLHGNAKTDAELAAALEAGVGTIVVDSLDEIDRLERLVTGEQAVLLRITPAVTAATHAAVLTGHRGSKFGLHGDVARQAIARLRASDKLDLLGLHAHLGSQILELEPFAQTVEALAGYGSFPVYDFGGGLGVPYRSGEEAPSVDVYAETVVGAAHRTFGTDIRIVVEPGRSLVANAVVTGYRVVTVKRDLLLHVAVDGGMGDNLEPSLYGTAFEARLLRRDGDLERCEVVGRHCESGDVLVRDAKLPSPRVDDLLVTPATGAYCFTMSNNYNGQTRPPVVFCRDGDARLVVRRERLEDLTARDVVSDVPA